MKKLEKIIILIILIITLLLILSFFFIDILKEYPMMCGFICGMVSQFLVEYIYSKGFHIFRYKK